MKRLPIELIVSSKEQRHDVTLTARFLNSLPIADSYKGLFHNVCRVRGWVNLHAYKDELIDIATNGCDVTKMFLENKMCGLSTLHLIVMNADLKKRTEVYQLIKSGGVKANREELEKILMIEPVPALDL